MKQIGQFITTDQKQLATQLSTLEQNIVKETGDIRANFLPAPVRVTARDGGTYTTGQAVLSETPAAGIKILLTASAPGFLIIINKTGNNINASPITGSIDLGSSENFAGGNALVFFDGTDWWRL